MTTAVTAINKTKIVATVGGPRGGPGDSLVDPAGTEVTSPLSHGELLTWFIEAGVDILRINMSFADHSKPYGANEAAYLRWLAANKGGVARRVGVLGDLPGPKTRLGKKLRGQEKLALRRGEELVLGFGTAPADASVLVNGQPFSAQVRGIDGYRDIGAYVQNTPDAVFSLADGKLRLENLTDDGNGRIRGAVSKDFEIEGGKGLTITGADLRVAAFQARDKRALRFLLQHADELLAYVAVSFVQTPEEILDAKWVIHSWWTQAGPRKRLRPPGVIAKIETRSAVNNISSILDVADGVMVARGDLGEQLASEEIPRIQKDLIRLCNARGKPVITATQMLDSMEKNPKPTRAEATDVFNAVLEGTDAVMLSGETSKGQYPVQAIRMMKNIAAEATKFYFLTQDGRTPNRRTPRELLDDSKGIVGDNTARLKNKAAEATTERMRSPSLKRKWTADLLWDKVVRSEKQTTTDQICAAACELSEEGDYRAIVSPTTSGRTVHMISRFRPAKLVIGAAHDARTFRKLLLSFGVFPVEIGQVHNLVGDALKAAVAESQKEGLLKPGSDDDLVEVVATSGTPLKKPGSTNLVQILRVHPLFRP